LQLAALGVLIAASMASLPQGRRLPGYAVVALLRSLLASLPGRLSVTTDVLALLVAVIAVAAAVRQRRLAAAVEAARPIAEADRMRTALLAAVSHDLRTPLAAAVAAVGCLRSGDIQLTDADQDERAT
jgi:two-component system, OmpR family, sensor histidine kinase KdpD